MDQVDNDITGFKLQKKLLIFQQHTEGAESVKRLYKQYNDIERLTMVDYFVGKEEHAKIIKACKESYKDHYMAKLSVTNCNSKKLCKDLATNKMFGKDLYPISTAESSNMIQTYIQCD